LSKTTLITTKLHPPTLRDETIPRDRLVRQLRVGPNLKLMLVACPAGFGKTTLLAAWREAEAARRPVAWLTLDEGDRDPTVLWSYVIEALRTVCPAISAAISPEVVGAAPITEVVLPRLVNELDEQGEFALILDDYHRLASGPASDSVAWFVEHAPSSFQLVVATRTEPQLHLPALRARGELVELRADDLRFTHEEARAFLNDRLSLGLSAGDVGNLVARTDGWPAGAYLAALSLGNVAEADRSARVSAFGVSSRHVVDYLVAEVIEAHGPQMQSFMRRTSILERLSGPLCDAVLQETDSAAVLDGLALTNLFLARLDDQSDWYRFHHLFAQLLRVQLERHEPHLIPLLHRRAYEWHRDNGSIDEAIHHAMAAGAFAEAADLVAAAYVQYGNDAKHFTVLSWLRAFPDEVLRGDPRLRLAEGWILAVCGRPEDAAAAIVTDERSSQLAPGPLLDGFPSIEANRTTLEAIFVQPAQGDVGHQLRLALRAAELVPPGAVWRSGVCWAVGWGLYFDGRFGEADRWFKESVSEGLAAQQWIATGSSLAYRSLIAGVLGRHSDQHRLACQAEELVREHRLEDVDGEAPLALGLSLAARDRLPETLPFVEHGVDCIRRSGQGLRLAHALLHEASVLRALGLQERATSAIAEGRSIIDSCNDPGIMRERLRALGVASRAPALRGEGGLTDRELTVLRLLSGQLSERDIGRELFLSHNTIHSHTTSIYRKLGVSSRTDALARARELDLL
jgi:LuxR family transcriptional regulator, maltose regulon positive regulatory protein